MKMSTTIRTTAIMLCSAALSVVPMMAQAPGGVPPGRPGGQMGAGRGGPMQGQMQGQMQDQMLDQMTKELSLTPDQVTQIKAIHADTAKEMMALRGDTSISQDDRRPKMMAMRQASHSKVRAVLTDEQKPKFDAMTAKMRGRMQNQGGMGAQTPPPPPQ